MTDRAADTLYGKTNPPKPRATGRVYTTADGTTWRDLPGGGSIGTRPGAFLRLTEPARTGASRTADMLYGDKK